MNSNLKKLAVYLVLLVAGFFVGKYLYKTINSKEDSEQEKIITESPGTEGIDHIESVWMSVDGKEVYHLTQKNDTTIELKDAKRRKVTNLIKTGEGYQDSLYTLKINDDKVAISYLDFEETVFKSKTYKGLFTLSDNLNSFELCDGSEVFTISELGTYNYLIKRYNATLNPGETGYLELEGKIISDNGESMNPGNREIMIAFTKKLIPQDYCD